MTRILGSYTSTEAYRVINTHYDFKNPEDEKRYHRLRFILVALCQIGKTGAYLHVPQLITELIRKGAAAREKATTEHLLPRPIIECEPLVEITDSKKWLLPNWSIMQSGLPLSTVYNKPDFSSDCHIILKDRLMALVQIAKQTDEDWCSKYCEWLKSSSGEHITSQCGLLLIDQLPDCIGNIRCPLDSSGTAHDTNKDTAALILALDWDGKLSSIGNNRWSLNTGARLSDFQHWTEHAVSMIDFGSVTSLQQQPRPWVSCHATDADTAALSGPHDAHDYVTTTASGNTTAHKAKDGKWYQQKVKLSSPDVKKSSTLVWDTTGAVSKHLEMVIASQQSNGDSELKWGKVTSPEVAAARWVFTPSIGSCTQALRDRTAALISTTEKPFNTVQVLVVRADNMKSYIKHCGNEYFILAMPNSIDVQALGLQAACGGATTLTYSSGGIGYARLFIQLFAYSAGFEHIWLLDDDIHYCSMLDVSHLKDRVNTKPCSFIHIMQSIEEFALPEASSATTYNSTSITEVAGVIGVDSVCPTADVLIRPKTAHSGSNRDWTQLADVTAHSQQYGVIGINRDIQQVHRLNQPFSVANSPHSLVLLNVKATVDRRAIYSGKQYMEDTEFNHNVDESGLIVAKCERFFHTKSNMRTASTACLTVQVIPISLETAYDVIRSDAPHVWVGPRMKILTDMMATYRDELASTHEIQVTDVISTRETSMGDTLIALDWLKPSVLNSIISTLTGSVQGSRRLSSSVVLLCFELWASHNGPNIVSPLTKKILEADLKDVVIVFPCARTVNGTGLDVILTELQQALPNNFKLSSLSRCTYSQSNTDDEDVPPVTLSDVLILTVCKKRQGQSKKRPSQEINGVPSSAHTAQQSQAAKRQRTDTPVETNGSSSSSSSNVDTGASIAEQARNHLICGTCNNASSGFMVLCYTCGLMHHLACVGLSSIPTDDVAFWLCPNCTNDGRHS
eukprot:2922-Heterococcus_DN1.PRE.4